MKEAVAGYGYTCFSVSEVFRPTSVDALAGELRRLSARGETPVFRGSGRSYGDASSNPGGTVVDLTGLASIRSLDEGTGVVTAEAGVTFEGLWRHAIPRGYWPPVVPGTMFPTLGGCVAMNIHGKNGYRNGTIGDHLEAVTVLSPSGERRRIARDAADFPRVVGRYGAAQPIVEVELHLKKVPSGWLDVTAFATPDLEATLAALDEAKDRHEYLVAWIDCFAGGRGQVHVADARPRVPGEDDGFSVAAQVSGTGLLEKLPKGFYAGVLGAFTFDAGMRFVNLGKFLAARLTGRSTFRQSYVGFSFLLDFVPEWRRVYLPGGFIQYQLFVPKDQASRVFAEVLRRQREAGVVSYLGVLKRHREDGRFANAYARDGFSLALDFPVTERNASRLITLCRGYDELLASCGGRLYKAKDCVDSLPHRSA